MAYINHWPCCSRFAQHAMSGPNTQGLLVVLKDTKTAATRKRLVQLAPKPVAGIHKTRASVRARAIPVSSRTFDPIPEEEPEGESLPLEVRVCSIYPYKDWWIDSGRRFYSLSTQHIQEIAMRIEVFSSLPAKDERADLFQFSRDWILMLNWELQRNPQRLHVTVISVDYKEEMRKWLGYNPESDDPWFRALEHEYVERLNICHILHMPEDFTIDWDEKYAPRWLVGRKYCRMKMLALLEPYLGEV